jgi:hypothetical protein
MTRTRARPPKGERAEVVEPFNHVSNISVIGSLSLNGVDAVMRIEGAVNAQVFDAIENRRKPPPEKMCLAPDLKSIITTGSFISLNTQSENAVIRLSLAVK